MNGLMCSGSGYEGVEKVDVWTDLESHSHSSGNYFNIRASINCFNKNFNCERADVCETPAEEDIDAWANNARSWKVHLEAVQRSPSQKPQVIDSQGVTAAGSA